MSLSREEAREILARGGQVGYTADGDIVEVGTGTTLDGDLRRESFPGSGKSANGESLDVYRREQLSIISPKHYDF